MKKFFSLLLLLNAVLFASAQSDTALSVYTGTYTFPEGSATPSVEITLRDGALFANSSIGTATMTKVSRDTFSLPEHNGMAYFSRNAEGKVVRIKVEVGDLLLIGDKQSTTVAWIRRRLAEGKLNS
ncbi:MAG TPA: DUF3471 domain-containing protein [Chitinophagaceae bacterium]|jgi:hypothetical protein|nr:DUF3471 domain-containing protein [Chitinophagaceae bacterium]